MMDFEVSTFSHGFRNDAPVAMNVITFEAKQDRTLRSSNLNRYAQRLLRCILCKVISEYSLETCHIPSASCVSSRLWIAEIAKVNIIYSSTL